MQSGIDTSRLRIAAETVFANQAAPSPDANGGKSAQASTQSASISFRDVLDTINPLNHIPIVSDIYSDAVGHKASPMAHVAGGALFGGPIGLVASIAGAIFEQEKGVSPAKALYAALRNDDSSTQLAMNDAAPVAEAATAIMGPVPEVEGANTATAAPIMAVEATTEAAAFAPAASGLALKTSRIPIVGAIQNAVGTPSVRDAAAVLDLYGASPASAHSSYQKAQMLPYLRDVSVSKTL